MFHKVLSEVRHMMFRKALYNYDFCDGTNKTSLILKYLLGSYKHNWNAIYQDAIAKYAEVPYAITFGAGRMALYAILEALDISSEDEVILPAFTCVVVPNAILYRGAKPVYVDIRPDTFNIDIDKIEEAITDKTKAIIAQHTFGQPCDIEAILAIARRHRIKVIEDCAHSFGALCKGQPMGTWGDVAFTSSDHSKVFSTSIGGFAFCSSPSLAQRLERIQRECPVLPFHCRIRLILQYGLLGFLNRPRVHWIGRVVINVLGRLRLWFYFHDELSETRPPAYPVRLPNFQAFVGWHEIQTLKENIRHRQAVAAQYGQILNRRDVVGEGAHLRYSILVERPEKWQRVIGKYFTVGRWFSSVTEGRSQDWGAIRYQPGSCPNGEFVTGHIINFPTHSLIDGKAMRKFRDLVSKSGLKGQIWSKSAGSAASITRKVPSMGVTL